MDFTTTNFLTPDGFKVYVQVARALEQIGGADTFVFVSIVILLYILLVQLIGIGRDWMREYALLRPISVRELPQPISMRRS